MAAVHTFCQIPKAFQCDGFLFLEIHPNQSFEGDALNLIQPGEAFCQVIQLQQVCC